MGSIVGYHRNWDERLWIGAAYFLPEFREVVIDGKQFIVIKAILAIIGWVVPNVVCPFNERRPTQWCLRRKVIYCIVRLSNLY